MWTSVSLELVSSRAAVITRCDEADKNGSNVERQHDAKPAVYISNYPVREGPGSKATFLTARAWLAACTSDDFCGGLDDVALPSRLIEVSDPDGSSVRLRVTKQGERARYATLSHCWGSALPFKLERRNLEDLQVAIDTDRLPRSFRDAIGITRQLGFRYLWIDAICIVQDDQADWEAESSKMTQTYSDCAVMIAAAAARDSNHGILRRRTTRQSYRFGRGGRFC